MPTMKKCKNCKQLIPNNAKECPNCGTKQSSVPVGCLVAIAIAVGFPIIIFTLAFIAGFISALTGSGSSQNSSAPESSMIVQTEPETEEDTTEAITEDTAEATTEPGTIPETEKITETPTETTERPTQQATEKPTVTEIKLFGELLDSIETDTYAVVKVKIKPSYSNEATIKQNYFNIETLVQKNGYDKYDEIQYWAVADMKDGSEAKVISFTVPKSTIEGLKSGTIPANLMGEEGYVTDLWILPSLLEND